MQAVCNKKTKKMIIWFLTFQRCWYTVSVCTVTTTKHRAQICSGIDFIQIISWSEEYFCSLLTHFWVALVCWWPGRNVTFKMCPDHRTIKLQHGLITKTVDGILFLPPDVAQWWHLSLLQKIVDLHPHWTLH